MVVNKIIIEPMKEAYAQDTNDESNNNYYINRLINDIEEAYSKFFKFIDIFIVKKNIFDINSKQLYMLYLVNRSGLIKTPISFLYRYYKGTNVSYTLKLMINNNYFVYEKDNKDKRSNIVFLTKKAKKLSDELDIELNKLSIKNHNNQNDYNIFSLFLKNICKDINDSI
jgi:DNA-binding MarR family transcriptional regulator